MSGWNRPKGETTKPKAEKPPSKLNGLIVGMIVVLVAAGIAWFIFSSGESKKAPADEGLAKTVRIKEVKPAAAPKAQPVVAKTNEVLDAQTAKERSKKGFMGFPELVTDSDGKQWFNGAPVPERSVGEGMLNGKPFGLMGNLRHRAERAVASLFVMNGGDRSFAPPGSVHYDDDFNQPFLDALMDPSEVKEDDDPEVVQFKNDTRAAMKEIQQRIKNGERLCDIMNQQFELTQKVAGIRDNYRQMIREAEMSGASIEDVVDTYTAANKLLDEYGARHIEMDSDTAAAWKKLQREKNQKKEK